MSIRVQTHILPGKRIEIIVPELPESGVVELVIYPPAEKECLDNVAPSTRYPVALMDEYRALVKQELAGTLTAKESARFQEVREQINFLDRQRSRPGVWDLQAQKLREELAQIRAEVEALPDA